jgi:hypothetical protein
MNAVILAWMYVVVLMAVIEAASTTGTVLGGFFTLLLYGVFPLALWLYFAGRGKRRRSADASAGTESIASAPDGGQHAPGDAIAPIRKEP